MSVGLVTLEEIGVPCGVHRETSPSDTPVLGLWP